VVESSRKEGRRGRGEGLGREVSEEEKEGLKSI